MHQTKNLLHYREWKGFSYQMQLYESERQRLFLMKTKKGKISKFQARCEFVLKWWRDVY